MTTDTSTTTTGHVSSNGVHSETATWTVKAGLAQMLKGGVIMDVVTADQARVAEEAGACAVMALERVPSDIRAAGGVARMSPVKKIEEIKRAVTIPVMAKARIGHFVEAQILEALGVDYIDESEVLTPADDQFHISKHPFTVPFVCGCRDLGEALRRINEGAAMIRTKGEAGTGDIVEAVRHMRALWAGIERVRTAPDHEIDGLADEYRVPRGPRVGSEAPRQAAGRELLSGRRGDSGRRGADDAARRRGRLRGLRHLQVVRDHRPAHQAGEEAAVEGPPAHGFCHREGGHALQRPAHAGRGLARPWRIDARHVRRVDGAGGAAGRPGELNAALNDHPAPGASGGGDASGPRIGVLAMQGAFAEHIAHLRRLGVDAIEVRTAEQLAACDGLIIPGGESTTIARLLIAFDLLEPLRERLHEGMPAWGTCAGAILLATDVPGLDRPPIGAMRIAIERNAFGRQVDSFETELDVDGIEGGPLRAVFIRAPVITKTGKGVEVLARLEDGRVVACRQGALLATSFHPELTPDSRLHELFVRMVADAKARATTRTAETTEVTA